MAIVSLALVALAVSAAVVLAGWRVLAVENNTESDIVAVRVGLEADRVVGIRKRIPPGGSASTWFVSLDPGSVWFVYVADSGGGRISRSPRLPVARGQRTIQVNVGKQGMVRATAE